MRRSARQTAMAAAVVWLCAAVGWACTPESSDSDETWNLGEGVPGEDTDAGPSNFGENGIADVGSPDAETEPDVELCPEAIAVGWVEGDLEEPADPILTAPSEVVVLSAENSQGSSGGELTYEWSLLSKPGSSEVEFEPDATDPTPQLAIDQFGTYAVELIVYSEDGTSSCQPDRLDIHAVGGEDVQVYLEWSSPEVEQEHGGPDPFEGIGTDLGMHYVHPEGYWGHSSLSVYWLHAHQEWGEHGSVSLNLDDLYGVDPEILTHDSPMDDGRYGIGVHYYCDKGYGESEATVRVFFGGVLYGEYQRTMEGTGDLWHVGDVVWSEDTPTVDIVDSYGEIDELTSC